MFGWEWEGLDVPRSTKQTFVFLFLHICLHRDYWVCKKKLWWVSCGHGDMFLQGYDTEVVSGVESLKRRLVSMRMIVNSCWTLIRSYAVVGAQNVLILHSATEGWVPPTVHLWGLYHYCPSFTRRKGAHGHLRGSGRDLLTPARLPGR